jgi:hypothetical protein
VGVSRPVPGLLPDTVPAVDEDAEIVARQLGRGPLPFTRVVARCAAGRPVAVEQPPATPAGAPFPTTFWLTCPGLVAAIGRLESDGGVAALERRLADEPELAAAFRDGRRRQIELRPSGAPLGIGGTRRELAVKCLHAHAAFALGAGGYPIGDAIVAAAGGIPEPCCMGDA